jgi:chemotaxis protein MotB
VEAGFSPTQLSIEGFAKYRLKVPNDSRQTRATNCKIEIDYQRGSVRKHMMDAFRCNSR